ncbi:MAG: hypothetical protein MUE73_18720, partial [Planctomycetes bacterium]|nr:hypothetical protein [Planctomycetota bacterium]
MRRTTAIAVRLVLAAGLALGAARGASAEPPAEEAAMVEAWRRAARLPPADTSRNVMDASDTVNIAVENLGRHSMEKGDFAEALCWWTEWTPSSWCGTCAEGMRARRMERIRTCREEIGKSDDAVKALGEKALDPERIIPEVALFWADLMIARGRREELTARVEAARADPRRAPGARVLAAWLGMLGAAERGDAEALWESVPVWASAPEGYPGGGPEAWRVGRAMDLLAGIPKAAIPVARRRLAADGGAEGYHAAILLSRLSDDGALPLLRARIDGETHWRRLSGWFSLVVSMGTEGALALAREYSEGKEPRRA